jgi:tight adherence protein B
MTEALRVGLFVIVGLAAVALAARRARTQRLRAAVIGRVSGVVPPDTRHARSIKRLLRQPPVLAAGVGGLIAGPVLGLLGGVVAYLAPIVTAAVLRSRADAAYDTTLAGALDGVGRSVRSGGSLPQAVAEASTTVRGAVASDLSRVASAVARGRPFADAVTDWRDARDRPSVRLTVGALALATQTGGPPARVIEDVASAIRTRQQVAREAHALAAQARLSALVIGLAPLAFMAITCLIDRRNAHVLFGTPIGVTCVVIGLGLDAVGAVWMHRMSESVAP